METHVAEHALEAEAAARVQRPRHVARRGQEVLLAFRADLALGALDEGVVGRTDALQEEVVAREVLACAKGSSGSASDAVRQEASGARSGALGVAGPSAAH
jgi:hypothetical protein